MPSSSSVKPIATAPRDGRVIAIVTKHEGEAAEGYPARWDGRAWASVGGFWKHGRATHWSELPPGLQIVINGGRRSMRSIGE